MKQVRDTSAGKSISVYVILNKKGVHVATVQAYFGNAVTVDCWHAYQRGKETPELQQGRAGGYGYDRFTAAISDFVIDGHRITDHCSRYNAPNKPKGRDTYPDNFKTPKGYLLANYDTQKGGWLDCYRRSGLNYLSDLGYNVIHAI